MLHCAAKPISLRAYVDKLRWKFFLSRKKRINILQHMKILIIQFQFIAVFFINNLPN